MKRIVFLCTHSNSYLDAISKDERFSLVAVYVPKHTDGLDKALKWENDTHVFNELEDLKPDHIVIFGWPKLLGPRFVNNYNIINIHPSYLPSWKGPDPVGNILSFEKKFGGITFHVIDENEDEGHVIYQELFELDYIYTRGQYLQEIQTQKYINILLNYILTTNVVFGVRAKRTKVNIREIGFKSILGLEYMISNKYNLIKIFRGEKRFYIWLGKLIIRL